MNIQKLDNSLFHYTSLETFLEYILPSKQLKLSKFSKSRDPYEYQTFSYFGVEGDTLLENESFIRYLISVNDLKFNSQYLCFTLSKSKQLTDGEILERHGYDRPKLWESYANNHRGVCLAFNKESVISSFEKECPKSALCKIVHKEIQYRDLLNRSDKDGVQPILDFFNHYKGLDIEIFLNMYLEILFFRKDYDYDDENEYRLCQIAENKLNDYRFSISNSLEAIIFGQKVEKEIIEYYYNLLKQEFPGLDIYQASWFNGTSDFKLWID